MLLGKRFLVMGVANERSIAAAIARALDREGASLILTYQNERLKDNVARVAKTLKMWPHMVRVDVTNPGEMNELFIEIGRCYGSFDGVVHSLAFAPKDALVGRFSDTTQEAFFQAMVVSVWSFIDTARRARSFMQKGGSIFTLTFIGGERVVENYKLMGVAKAALQQTVRELAYEFGPDGIRVNAISAGPLQTLAARGLSDFTQIKKTVDEVAPLGATDAGSVADSAVYLLSDMSRSVTGSVVYVDSGAHILGMAVPHNAVHS